MANVWVVNASPLIALANIGRSDLLTRLGREVLDAIAVVPTVLMWGLGEGETHVLSHAVTDAHAEAILDDLAARRCAVAHGLRYRGTVGLIVLAKQQGFLSAVRPVLVELGMAGFYVSPSIVEAALHAADET